MGQPERDWPLPPTRATVTASPLPPRWFDGAPLDFRYSLVSAFAQPADANADTFLLSYPYHGAVEISAAPTGYEWAILQLHVSSNSDSNLVSLGYDDTGFQTVWCLEMPESAGSFTFPHPGQRIAGVPQIKQSAATQLYAEAQFVLIPTLPS
jgi:hypothetical protein